MLSERDRELLTAYVDGELSSRQRRHVVRLLQRSAEARALLLGLQEDAHTLKRLPRAHPADDLSATVLRSIFERGLHHARRRAAVSAVAPFPAWAGVAAAAAVLLVAGMASYLYFTSSLVPTRLDPVATKPIEKVPPAPKNPQEAKPVPVPLPERVARAEGRKAPQGIEVASAKPAPPEPVAVVKGIPSPKPTPTPEPGGEPMLPASDPLAAQNDKALHILRAQVDLPSVVSMRELEKLPQRQQLAEELGKGTAAHLELPCRDGTRATQRLLAVLKAQKIETILDAVAEARLKSPQWQTNYVVFIEDLTPEELARLFQALGQEEKQGIAHRPPDVRFTGQLIVARMLTEEHQELKLLGIDLPEARRTPPPGKPAVDLHRPLSEQTGDEVKDALAGKGVPRPGAGKGAPGSGRRTALVMTHGLVRPRRDSAEIKRFLAGRKPGRPGTVSILLLIRAVSV